MFQFLLPSMCWKPDAHGPRPSKDLSFWVWATRRHAGDPQKSAQLIEESMQHAKDALALDVADARSWCMCKKLLEGRRSRIF